MSETRPVELGAGLRAAGVSIHHDFAPGDLGRLILIHGVQNARDYGFNAVHEAYCARIAADYLIDGGGARGRFWLAKRGDAVVGSVLIIETPGGRAQLRILFVDDSARGLGLGRWLVEDAVRYCRAAGFAAVFLWTVEGLQRAEAVYRSLGFKVVETKTNEDWGGTSTEVRYELKLG
ncbi:MAG: N-acetyltransferase [Nevskia sp.]|nr:N-acetyltransferase [Nevskia sp.]